MKVTQRGGFWKLCFIRFELIFSVSDANQFWATRWLSSWCFFSSVPHKFLFKKKRKEETLVPFFWGLFYYDRIRRSFCPGSAFPRRRWMNPRCCWLPLQLRCIMNVKKTSGKRFETNWPGRGWDDLGRRRFIGEPCQSSVSTRTRMEVRRRKKTTSSSRYALGREERLWFIGSDWTSRIIN